LWFADYFYEEFHIFNYCDIDALFKQYNISLEIYEFWLKCLVKSSLLLQENQIIKDLLISDLVSLKQVY